MSTATKEPVAKKEKKIIEIEDGPFAGEKVTEGSPEHKALSQRFDPLKKYMFKLAFESTPRELPVYDFTEKRSVPHKPYKPYHNIVFTSSIVWNGNRRVVRYYDGCSTIFQDKQPREKDVIDQLLNQTQRRNFNDGKFGAFGDEMMLLFFMSICSWNGDSLFRTRSADVVFLFVDAEKAATVEEERLDMMEQAMKFAREASPRKMMIHGGYLGIPMIDFDSSNPLTEKEIRVYYRKEAAKDAAGFIGSYGNQSIEIKYFIKKALESGLISTKANPNKAMLGNMEVCDISGLRTNEAIEIALYEFTQTEAGSEFLVQLRALNED